MKNYLLILLWLTLPNVLRAQDHTYHLILKSNQEQEQNVLDSFNYQKSHLTIYSLEENEKYIEENLFKMGYLNLTRTINVNANTYTYLFDLKKQIKHLTISTPTIPIAISTKLGIKNNTHTIPLQEMESYIKKYTSLLEQQGEGTTTVKLTNHQIKNDTLYGELLLNDYRNPRKLNAVQVQTKDKLPLHIIARAYKKELNQTYNNATVHKITKQVNDLAFVKEIKPAETLFTDNNTILYLYLAKKNVNQFDGYFGFGNNQDSKFALNGYLDLKLLNILNRGEALNLYWKNDGNKQSTFNFDAELPFIFKTPIALKGALNIQRQDTIYQNSQTNLQLGYYLSYNHRIYLGYKSTTSTTNTNLSAIDNYKNTFIQASYLLVKNNIEQPLFPIDYKVEITGALGTRTLENNKIDQSSLALDLQKNAMLSPTSYLYIRWRTHGLYSDTYLLNELIRLGGNNSLRGFQDNSLYATHYTLINTEYRYLLSSYLYIHSIIDYAFQQNKMQNQNNHLYSFGFGLGMLTKSGKFNLSFANGKQPDQTIKFDNTTVHITFSTVF